MNYKIKKNKLQEFQEFRGYSSLVKETKHQCIDNLETSDKLHTIFEHLHKFTPEEVRNFFESKNL